ncbi:hypothetical protein NY2A_b502R [Paramecium bursaria Chlorella virus NY2A]|uniref:Uncharacterized protein b502R n=1 Tax=Paramecium bursaria Chlorella virus NY2A TaxID=46021 RepID=A7IX27_PBCVN|nr:hypothetical protein NY2A_b502R [Paramecium bursaria Chlorella virus NY2A]ABT14901.1 hypothetical protein NY2A_b502R [Paramecium bursaria Chlorella virus NY2A]
MTFVYIDTRRYLTKQWSLVYIWVDRGLCPGADISLGNNGICAKIVVRVLQGAALCVNSDPIRRREEVLCL